MYVDVVDSADSALTGEIKKLGFSKILGVDNKGRITDPENPDAFSLNTYAGNEYDFVIRKGKTDVLMDIERNGFTLDKGLCHKIKENGMFVLFKMRNLVETDDLFKMYRLLTINCRLCNDYSVNCLFVSFASKETDIKAPMQLVAFAEQFGYRYNNYRKSLIELAKKI